MLGPGDYNLVEEAAKDSFLLLDSSACNKVHQTIPLHHEVDFSVATFTTYPKEDKIYRAKKSLLLNGLLHTPQPFIGLTPFPKESVVSTPDLSSNQFSDDKFSQEAGLSFAMDIQSNQINIGQSASSPHALIENTVQFSNSHYTEEYSSSVSSSKDDLLSDKQCEEASLMLTIPEVQMNPIVSNVPVMQGSSGLPSSDLICEWDGCTKAFETSRTLIQHVNTVHIAKLPWSSRSNDERQTLACRWKGCWNTHPFAYEQRLIEHVRCHTLEQPYMCPVKHCHARFTVRSNCLAHGRSKHAKSKLFRPVFIDISLSEKDVQSLLLQFDDNGRNAMDTIEDLDPYDSEYREKGWDRKKQRSNSTIPLTNRQSSFENLSIKRKRATSESNMFAQPILTTEGRMLKNLSEMKEVKDSVQTVASWCKSMYTEVEQVSERYLKLASLLSDHSTTSFTESVGHFTQSVGNLEAMCQNTLIFVEGDTVAKIQANLDIEQSTLSMRSQNAISSAC